VARQPARRFTVVLREFPGWDREPGPALASSLNCSTSSVYRQDTTGLQVAVGVLAPHGVGMFTESLCGICAISEIRSHRASSGISWSSFASSGLRGKGFSASQHIGAGLAGQMVRGNPPKNLDYWWCAWPAAGTSAVSAASASAGISDKCSWMMTHRSARFAKTAVHAPAMT